MKNGYFINLSINYSLLLLLSILRLLNVTYEVEGTLMGLVVIYGLVIAPFTALVSEIILLIKLKTKRINTIEKKVMILTIFYLIIWYIYVEKIVGINFF